jgi:hypothetical protein
MKMGSEQRSTSDIGLSRIGEAGGPSFAEKLADLLSQIEISRVMAQVLASPRYSPEPRSMADTPTPRVGAGAAAQNGWVESRPLETPGGQQSQDLIAQLCGSQGRPLSKVVEEAVAKLKAQQAGEAQTAQGKPKEEG